MEEIQFYDLKNKTKFKTTNYRFEERKNRFYVISKSPNGNHDCWKPIGRDKIEELTTHKADKEESNSVFNNSGEKTETPVETTVDLLKRAQEQGMSIGVDGSPEGDKSIVDGKVVSKEEPKTAEDFAKKIETHVGLPENKSEPISEDEGGLSQKHKEAVSELKNELEANEVSSALSVADEQVKEKLSEGETIVGYSTTTKFPDLEVPEEEKVNIQPIQVTSENMEAIADRIEKDNSAYEMLGNYADDVKLTNGQISSMLVGEKRDCRCPHCNKRVEIVCEKLHGELFPMNIQKRALPQRHSNVR